MENSRKRVEKTEPNRPVLKFSKPCWRFSESNFRNRRSFLLNCIFMTLYYQKVFHLSTEKCDICCLSIISFISQLCSVMLSSVCLYWALEELSLMVVISIFTTYFTHKKLEPNRKFYDSEPTRTLNRNRPIFKKTDSNWPKIEKSIPTPLSLSPQVSINDSIPIMDTLFITVSRTKCST